VIGPGAISKQIKAARLRSWHLSFAVRVALASWAWMRSRSRGIATAALPAQSGVGALLAEGANPRRGRYGDEGARLL